MCDIWKGNKNVKQLTKQEVAVLLKSLEKLSTRQVVLSGGEAMLHPEFFTLCTILREANLKITLLTTGLTLRKNADQLVNSVSDIIISLDGNEQVHDRIRNIPGAFAKLTEGVQYIKSKYPGFRINARSVIHKSNYRIWPEIIDSAVWMGLDQISFLPADVSSQAFNREILWNELRQAEVRILGNELPNLNKIIENLIEEYKEEFEEHFIAESPDKIRKIFTYYSAIEGLNDYPVKKCNAPWVSTVIEADGNVRPCFFQEPIGNIRDNSLPDILNGEKAVGFRKSLDTDTNSTCKKCVCYLNLRPSNNP
jgi:MoaA/NifB/PqqE/SkfB family radical SAM enzyme